MRSAALDSTLLLTGDSLAALQTVRLAGDTAYILTVVFGVHSALCDHIGDGTACLKQSVRNSGVAAIDNDSGAQIGSRALVDLVGYAITLRVDNKLRHHLPSDEGHEAKKAYHSYNYQHRQLLGIHTFPPLKVC